MKVPLIMFTISALAGIALVSCDGEDEDFIKDEDATHPFIANVTQLEGGAFLEDGLYFKPLPKGCLVFWTDKRGEGYGNTLTYIDNDENCNLLAHQTRETQ